MALQCDPHPDMNGLMIGDEAQGAAVGGDQGDPEAISVLVGLRAGFEQQPDQLLDLPRGPAFPRGVWGSGACHRVRRGCVLRHSH